MFLRSGISGHQGPGAAGACRPARRPAASWVRRPARGPAASTLLQIQGRDGLELFLLGFGQDGGGEIYVLANSTGVPFGETGVVLEIVGTGGHPHL